MFFYLGVMIMGFFIQKFVVRLGVVLGSYLVEFCRVEYFGWVCLVFWVMIEIVIIGVDVQQVIGSIIVFWFLLNGWIFFWVGVFIIGIDWYVYVFNFILIFFRGICCIFEL